MTLPDILLLLGVAVWAAAAVKNCRKRRKHGCGGNCGCCSESCQKEKDQ